MKANPMNHRRWMLVTLCGVVALGLLFESGAAAPKKRKGKTPAAALGDGFEAYQILLERNIFSSTRIARRRETNANMPTPTPAPDSADLIGSWMTDQQTAAFTEGSKPEYTGALKAGGMIGDWKITEIQMDHVLLEKDGKKMIWPVGRRIEKDKEGNWLLSDKEATPLQPSSAPASAQPASSSGGAGADDLLQRMRERRKRETAQ